MRISDTLLPEFDQEMASTRKVLERCPESKFGWRPHAKSWTMAELATHVANLPDWANETLKKDSLDYAPADGSQPYKREAARSSQELLADFDKNVASARAAITETSDEGYAKLWTLLAGGQKIFSIPRVAVLRSFVFNHIIHHRGQLSVYLRLNDIPVPGMYGPSADEAS
ncbi:MAG TPA: DinB family protein [Bryobacteraceae bacterium]